MDVGSEVAGMMVAIGSALAAAALLTAAADDLERRTIPNAAAAAVALSALPFLAGLSAALILAHVALAIFGLAAGTWAFARGLLGGGDVKLFAATLLWAGPDMLQLHLAGTALVAVGIGVAMLGRQALASRSGMAEPGAAPPEATMPLGVAIAAGGLLVLLSRVGLLGGPG
ncbi:MAG: prepilin peptidase [Thermaurantiacus sp.]